MAYLMAAYAVTIAVLAGYGFVLARERRALLRALEPEELRQKQR